MMAYIILVILIVLTLYLYNKNTTKCNHNCSICKGCKNKEGEL